MNDDLEIDEREGMIQSQTATQSRHPQQEENIQIYSKN